MIGIRLTVPIACWRKAHARELVETELLPPPSTCYGMLLSLVGEVDRDRHRGCRVTPGWFREPGISTVIRTFWQTKSLKLSRGNNANAGPDFQQLAVGADLAIWCDSDDEPDPGAGLEARVRRVFEDPDSIERFGGLSLGESTHLVNDLWRIPETGANEPCRLFLLDPDGAMTLPVWVDHVGSSSTRYAVGNVEPIAGCPDRRRLPVIPLPSA